MPPKNGIIRSANCKTLNKKSRSVGIPDETVELIHMKSDRLQTKNNEKSFSSLELQGESLFLNLRQENDESLNLLTINEKMNIKRSEPELNTRNSARNKVDNTDELMSNSKKLSSVKKAWQRYVDSAGRGKTEDSGYLSTDSYDSRAPSTSQNERGL